MVSSICSGAKGGRSWRGCPGWAPMVRCRLPLGRGGLTISLEGGFEELPEFFRALARSASKSATLALSAAFSTCKAWQRPQRVVPDIAMMGDRLNQTEKRKKTNRKSVNGYLVSCPCFFWLP